MSFKKKEHRKKYPHGIIRIRCGGAAHRKFSPRVRNTTEFKFKKINNK